MAQTNVAVVQDLNDAFNRGDYEVALALVAQDVEWQVPPDVSIGDEVYRGIDELERGFALWLGAWESYRFEFHEVLDYGEHVVVAGTHTGRGRGSGVEVRLPTFNVFTVRDGKVTLMRNFDDRAAALAAVASSD
ncbi:MAG TPA: nuclear transport factor 2 family protein [Thermoleophilaceae bacterium]